MTPERWRQIEKIFYYAIECEPGERSAFLDEACAGDPALRRDLETLLAAHAKPESRLEVLKADVAAELLAEDATGRMVGQTLGRYQLLSPLGAGGMGEVYRALDTRLDREVAIKILPAHLADNPEAMRRFEREAKAVAALSHPNILAIHDFGTEKGVFYAVMELLKGETLRSRLSRGALPWRKAVGIGIETAEGLSAAHAKGITHRDLKPENIFLTSDGRTKILDFGLARVKAEIAAEHITSAPTEPLMTAPGLVMGTIGYMSPEQLRGEKADAPSDIFSFGCVLYEMISGQRAFRRETPMETNAAILRDDPPELADSVKNIPAELERVMTHCMEKNPSERFQSARDLTFALRSISSSATIAKPSTNSQPHRFRLTSLTTWIAVVFGIALLTSLLLSSIQPTTPTRQGQIEALAVLPFKNLSGKPEEEYFADGMTDELIDSLNKISALRVISRTSIMQYKEKPKPLPQIANELKVDAVIEGSVMRSGEKVRIISRLIHGATEKLLWTGSFERDLRNILDLQSQIALAIAREIQAKLTPQEQDRLARAAPTVNPEAYQLYLKGLYNKGHSYLEKRNEEDIKKAIDYFNLAVVKDPNYAMAYVGLANAYILGEGTLPSAVSMRIARLAAMNAQRLDNTLADAHTSLAVVHMLDDWDWPAAEKEFKQAIELQPSNATAHHWYAEYLTAMGMHNNAIDEIKRAKELDPFSARIQRDVGWHYYCAGDYSQAITQCQKTFDLDPNFIRARTLLGLVYTKREMFAEAIAELLKAAELSQNNSQTRAMLAYAYALSGQREKARQILDVLDKQAKNTDVSPHLFAIIYSGLGENDRAFTWLEKSFMERSQFLVYLKVHPTLDGLRSDPRFHDWAQRVGLP